MLNSLDDFLKEAIVIAVGKSAEEIADLLSTRKYINEFLIAKKLDITINQTRNILYKLADRGLVSSIRKKDKKKGWYTYFWKMEILKSLEFIKDILEKKRSNLGGQIKSKKEKQFYICERCNVEFNEETALIYDFTCNECGRIFSLKDNIKDIKDFEREMDKIKKEISSVEREIEKETEKVEKEKIKELAKKEKEEMKKKLLKKKLEKKEKPAKKKIAKKLKKEKKKTTKVKFSKKIKIPKKLSKKIAKKAVKKMVKKLVNTASKRSKKK
ncbi:MAG TPA: hypothetical protein VJH65_02240 [Candidatus Nanoarchaeia archaeon]|nr:hypothetical protein [Candidatus Nanoarchaeia archaeon]